MMLCGKGWRKQVKKNKEQSIYFEFITFIYILKEDFYTKKVYKE